MSKTFFGPRSLTTFRFPGSMGLNKAIYALALLVPFCSAITRQAACVDRNHDNAGCHIWRKRSDDCSYGKRRHALDCGGDCR